MATESALKMNKASEQKTANFLRVASPSMLKGRGVVFLSFRFALWSINSPVVFCFCLHLEVLAPGLPDEKNFMPQ
jgi:hypothetical protein